MKSIQLLLVSAIVAIGLAASTGSAAAATTTIRPGGAITASGATTFSTGLATITCNLALAGSITAGTYSAGSDYGQISAPTATGCTGGATIIWLFLPWRLRLLEILINPSFGILTGLLTSQFRITIRGGLFCLYRALWGLLTGVGIGLWRFLAVTWVLDSGSPGCAASMRATGDLSVSPAQTVSVTP